MKIESFLPQKFKIQLFLLNVEQVEPATILRVNSIVFDKIEEKDEEKNVWIVEAHS